MLPKGVENLKLIHLSDLHLGKRLNNYSLMEDQADILKKILKILDDEQPDGVMIAGDVYDKSIPSAEAVERFDWFLVQLAERRLPTFVISGNHDSPERLSFGSRLMDVRGVYISPVYRGEVQPVPLRDGFGVVDVWMLPFLKPILVRQVFPEEKVESYTDAVRVAVGALPLDPTHRNVLITHQFVTGAQRSDSEELSVGGADNVDASVFDAFDYTALGHIHGPQNIGSERIRYCGTPLKYSFSEADHEKSVTVVELGQKGELSVRTVPLTPLRDLKELRGTYEALTARSFYEGTTLREDYTHITLTDEEDIPEAFSKLQVIYRNLMKLDYDNQRTRHSALIDSAGDVERKSPLELFAEFYTLQNGSKLTAEQSGLLQTLIEKIWEGEP